MTTDQVDSINGDVQIESESKSEHVEATFTVEVLQMIKEAQQQHGLRHGDYQRYRSYCSRRLRRLRKSLHFPQGSKHKVVPKKITPEIMKDVKFLHIPLTCAERAWSYAMQLKSEANTEPRKRWHLLARLGKAVQHADEFSKLCESEKVDARTKLEAQAYSAWMKATLLFEMNQWKPCIEHFSKAKTIYEKLCGAVGEDEEAVYRQRVDEITPNIRYCAYNIGDETAINDLIQMRVKGKGDMFTSTLDELLSQTREKQAATLSEVTWNGHIIPVKNESARLFLLSVQASETELKQADDVDGKVSVLESLLKDSIDTLQNLRDELKSDQVFRSAQRGQKLDQPMSKLHLLHSYVTYIRITKTIQRNLLLIESFKSLLGSKAQCENRKQSKPQDLARLYDIIIQSLSEICHLAGVDEDSPIVQEAELKSSAYKAFRCFYIAQTYAGVKKWAEALALYERVSEYASDSMKDCRASKQAKNEPFVKDLVADLERLVKEVDGLKYSVQASSILDVDDTVDQMAGMKISAKKALLDRLEAYTEDPSLTTKRPNLTAFPPEFRPVPCKPLFFDLALNHIEMPSLEDKLEKKKTSGLTSFVKGWLWGK